MKIFSKMFRRPRHSSKKQLAVVIAVLMAFTSAGVLGVTSMANYSKADAACIGDPSGNAIMRCGAADRAEFISNVKSSAELQKIYAYVKARALGLVGPWRPPSSSD